MTITNLALKGDPKLLPVIIGLDREVSALEERDRLRAIRESKTPVTAKEALEAFRRAIRGEEE